MGDPLCARLTGIVINQPDLPHWATSILNWIGMVQAMQQASGDIGKIYREMTRQVLEEGGQAEYVNTRTGKVAWLSGPGAIVGVYQSFCMAMEADR